MALIPTPINLHGHAEFLSPGRARVVRIVGNDPDRAWTVNDAVILQDEEPVPRGCTAVLLTSDSPPTVFDGSVLAVRLPVELGYIGAGDVLHLNPDASAVHVLYRAGANANALLVTEQCNSYCTMCSQPPKAHDDSHLAARVLEAIPLIDPSAPEIAISGGEPTLLGARFYEIVETAKRCLPATALHILTNGRLFAYLERAVQLGAIEHHDLMLGIPLYSDLPWQHDYVVQARGAFDQTIQGMLNLARAGVRIELRVVIHRDTYGRLPHLGRFIARNLPFVEHVALMGLEITGHTPMNLNALWIDPVEYQPELKACVEPLDRSGVLPRIFNHQLCVLDRSLWPYAVRSISDWKNIYVEACQGCLVRERCGGFFASSVLRRSEGIHAVCA